MKFLRGLYMILATILLLPLILLFEIIYLIYVCKTMGLYMVMKEVGDFSIIFTSIILSIARNFFFVYFSKAPTNRASNP